MTGGERPEDIVEAAVARPGCPAVCEEVRMAIASR
jgi:hypothetical protein